jgi:hypothetical protein
MNAEQPELPGMPPAASLVRSLRRPDLVRLVAQARVGYAIAATLGTRHSISASPALELARTICGASFTHDDRLTLAALATLPVRGFSLPPDALLEEDDVRAMVPVIAGESRRALAPVFDLLRHMEGGNDV